VTPSVTARTSPLPVGFRIELDRDAKRLDDLTLFGGSPTRLLRLTPKGVKTLSELSNSPIRSKAAGVLARTLTDAGIAHPLPPELGAKPDVTVIIPVRDRPAMLHRCLAALGTRYPVVVVDDGSADPAAVVEIAAAHGANLLRRKVNGGPAAARNTGLNAVSSEFVAFIDSDCVADEGWIEALAAHMGDPLVAVVAPRIVAIESGTWAGRYTTACCSLDLGDHQARVVPSTRVAYVPSAALIIRRAALADVADPDVTDADVFDETLRSGEDVDLIWRLHAKGWRIRYDPVVRVGHEDPDTWRGLLSRRMRYGKSAGELAQRHPGAMRPLTFNPWPAVTVTAILARRPAIAAIGFAGATTSTARSLRKSRLPVRRTIPIMAFATHQIWLGTGRYFTQFAAPLLVAAIVQRTGDNGRSTPLRRFVALSLLLGQPITTWFVRRPKLDPARFIVGQLAEEIAYGTGVWLGAIRVRNAIPVLPAIAWKSHRSNSSPNDK
jgi:mycofactocin system glycosyltransferase